MGKHMPDIVAQIVWVRQIRCKVDETLQTVSLLMHDLDGSKAFLDESKDFVEELKASENERVCLFLPS